MNTTNLALRAAASLRRLVLLVAICSAVPLSVDGQASIPLREVRALELRWDHKWSDTASGPELMFTVQETAGYPYLGFRLVSDLSMSGHEIRLAVAGAQDPCDIHYARLRHDLGYVPDDAVCGIMNAISYPSNSYPFPALPDSGHFALVVTSGDREARFLLTARQDGFDVSPPMSTFARTEARRVRLPVAGTVEVFCNTALEPAFCREFFKRAPHWPLIRYDGRAYRRGRFFVETVDSDPGSRPTEAGEQHLSEWFEAAKEYSSFFEEVSVEFDLWRGQTVLCSAGSCTWEATRAERRPTLR